MTRAVLVALALAVLAGPVAAQVPDDTLIVPGVRIGKWTLEMTIPSLIQLNGPTRPSQTASADTVSGYVILGWDAIPLAAGTRDNNRIEYLTTYDKPRFKTETGIGIGSSRGAVLAAYGAPTATTQPDAQWTRLIYDGGGIAVLLLPEGTGNIYVFRPGTARSIWVF